MLVLDILLWFMVVWMTLGIIGSIAFIGREREPTTPLVAYSSSAIVLGFIAILIWAVFATP